MKIALLLTVSSLFLGGCVSYEPHPAPISRTIYVPANVQTVYVVRETPVYYPPVRWSIGIGFGSGRHHGPWRR